VDIHKTSEPLALLIKQRNCQVTGSGNVQLHLCSDKNCVEPQTGSTQRFHHRGRRY
jgi:hypothetical protein